MIPLLEPIFRGDHAHYGETLVCDTASDALRAQQGILLDDFLADEKLLGDVLARYARRMKCRDLRPVVSAWTLDYFLALLPPVVAAASVLHHGFPVSSAEIALVLDEHGGPVGFRIPHEGSLLAGQSAAGRYDALVWKHLAPLIERLAQRTPVNPKLLWSNAARYIDAILEQALPLDQGAATVAEDRHILLAHASWPDGRTNPLSGGTREISKAVDDTPATLRLHRQCCLYYLLPGQGYCRACPQAPDNRKLRARNSK